jgi:hypothetical protein
MHCPKYRQVTSIASGKEIEFADDGPLIWLLYALIALTLLSHCFVTLTMNDGI